MLNHCANLNSLESKSSMIWFVGPNRLSLYCMLVCLFLFELLVPFLWLLVCVSANTLFYWFVLSGFDHFFICCQFVNFLISSMYLSLFYDGLSVYLSFGYIVFLFWRWFSSFCLRHNFDNIQLHLFIFSTPCRKAVASFWNHNIANTWAQIFSWFIRKLDRFILLETLAFLHLGKYSDQLLNEWH